MSTETPTFTIDARLSDGTLAEEHGVSAEDVARARINAPRLGIEILSVTEETPVDASALRAFGVDIPAASPASGDLTGREFTRDGYPFRVTGPAAGVPGTWEARGRSGVVAVPDYEITGEMPLDARENPAPGNDDLCWSCQEQAIRFTAGGEGRCSACPDDYSAVTDEGHESDMSHTPLDARSEAPVEFGADVELYTPADALNPEEWTPAREITGAALSAAIARGLSCAAADNIEHPATRLYDVADAGWFAYCWLHGRTRAAVPAITGDVRLDARLARGQ